MRKLLFLTILIISSFNASARDAWVDKKEICAKTMGNWRLFNNDCSDSCESTFSLPVCTSILLYNCDCGENRCFDGDKCIANAVAKKFWDNIADKNRAKRKKELEDLGINLQITDISATKSLPNNSHKIDTTNKNNLLPPKDNLAIPPTTTIEEIENNPGLIDPKIAEMQNSQKLLCTQQKGIWKKFDNGCVDNCSNKISKISICTDAKTFGCQCGENKCWDNAKKSCIATEEYRKSTINQMVPSSISSLSAQPKL